MNVLPTLPLLAGYLPLLRALGANRRTTLRPAIIWLIAAWTAAVASAVWSDSRTAPYLALSPGACAGVAVLGARRPGVGAWNFVVGGLLVVLLLPVASGFGTPRLEPAHVVFLSATLAVVLLNYLPTRTGAGVPLAVVAVTVEIARLAGIDVPSQARTIGMIALALAPWIAWLALSRKRPSCEVDRVWLGFRDGFGFLWAERVREQFNRSLASAGRSARLGWNGLRSSAEDQDVALQTLQALLRRFGPPANDASGQNSAN
jgi:hypothetical protein